MGDLKCLSVKDGKEIWAKKLTKVYKCETPLWGFSGHPLIDGDRLICLVGGKGSLVVCFDKYTGKEVWKNLDFRESGYAPPMIFTIADKRQLIMWHPEGVHSLNPKTGEVYWYQRFPRTGALRANMSIPTPRYEDGRLFVSCFYNGSMMLKLDETGMKPTVLWQDTRIAVFPDQTTGLHCVMSTPFVENDHIFGVGSYGELRCLEADTGKRLWKTFEPTSGKEPVRWANAFLVKHETKYFIFNENGDLVIAHLSPKGYQEWDRAKIITPTNQMVNGKKFRFDRRPVVWTHPAFANRCIVVRNDNEIIRISLAEDQVKE